MLLSTKIQIDPNLNISALIIDFCRNIPTCFSDLFGVKKAGVKTVYIKRKEEIYNPYFCPPNFSKKNLVELADEIVKNKI